MLQYEKRSERFKSEQNKKVTYDDNSMPCTAIHFTYKD